MGNSFQDQLLKAGLVSKKQVKKARQEKHSKRKKNKGRDIAPEINKTRQEQLAREKKNREQNRQRNREKQEQETLAQVRQLVENSRLDLKGCDDPYYFALGKKVKKVYVNKEITQKLSTGTLAIVSLDNGFDIVPARVAEQVRNRAPQSVVVMHTPGNQARTGLQ